MKFTTTLYLHGANCIRFDDLIGNSKVILVRVLNGRETSHTVSRNCTGSIVTLSKATNPVNCGFIVISNDITQLNAFPIRCVIISKIQIIIATQQITNFTSMFDTSSPPVNTNLEFEHFTHVKVQFGDQADGALTVDTIT